jgi:hypothetical protein
MRDQDGIRAVGVAVAAAGGQRGAYWPSWWLRVTVAPAAADEVLGRTLAHLAQHICLGGVPAGHHRYPRCLAQPCAAPVERAVADHGVPACRDRYRVGSTRADGNITVNAGARHGHGPRPRTRQPRCRPADSIQVTSQGAIGGVLRRARRREPGQEHSSQGQTDQGDSHSRWTKRACRAVPGVRRTCASPGSCGALGLARAISSRRTVRCELSENDQSACHGPFGQEENTSVGAVTVSRPDCRTLLMGPWLTCRSPMSGH